MAEETNSKDNSPKEAPSIPALEKYIFEPDAYTSGVIPRGLSAPEVAKFLIGKIEKNLKLKSFMRVEGVAKFYETFEIVEKFKRFLDKSEANEEDVRRSIVIARIVAYLGKPEDVEFAKQYYKYLIGRAESAPEFEDLILLHEAVGLGGSSDELRQKIQSKTASLEAKKDDDYQAFVQYANFKESIGQKLYRAEKVESIKARILNMTDRRKRIDEEIKMYLTLDYGFIEYLQPWATGRLRRETWALQPNEQIQRNDSAKFKEDVAKSFRAFLGKDEEFAEMEREEKDSMQLRLLRAIKFFDGTISAEEESFLEEYKGKQLDLLANEGFNLP